MQRAIEIDPTFIQARISLWAALSNQSMRAEADAALRPLEEAALFGRASPAEQSYIRYAHALLDGNLTQAAAAAREFSRLTTSGFMAASPGIHTGFLFQWTKPSQGV